MALVFSLSFIVIREIAHRVSKAQQPRVKIGAVIFMALLVFGAIWMAKPDFSANASHRAATSNNLRYEIWRTTVTEIIPAHPLAGVGLGNYQDYFTALTAEQTNFAAFIAPWARTPHNVLLNIWVNLGLVGLVGFIWLLVIFFAEVWPKRTQSPLHFALIIAMLTLLVHGLVDATYWKNDLSVLFWMLLALGYVAREHDDPKEIV